MKKAKTGRTRPSAKAKPMRQGAKAVAKELPYPIDQEAAKAEATQLVTAMRAGTAARMAEAIARARKTEQFDKAKALAERLRLYVDANSIAPEANKDLLSLVDEATYAVEESSRESAFLAKDEAAFVAEARTHGDYKLFVRVKEEADMETFLLSANRKKADLYKTASIEHAHSVVIRVQGVEAPLRYVTNEKKPKWDITFPSVRK